MGSLTKTVMTKGFLIIILLTVVYSWGQFQELLVNLRSKIFKRHKNKFDYQKIDEAVGMLLVFATFPFAMACWIFGQGGLNSKLLLIAVQLLIAGFLIFTLGLIKNWEERRRNTNIYSAVFSTTTSLVSMPFKTFILPQKKIVGQFATLMLAPVIVGLALKYASTKSGAGSTEIFDQLIGIAVAGLALLLAIQFLEHHFRLYRLHLAGLLRVLLGIVIIFALY